MGRVGLPELAFGSIGFPELAIMLVIVVVVFGAFQLEAPRGDTAGTSRWARTDWILLIAAIVSIGVATALSIARRS